MILLSYGTRPEYIKLKPLMHELEMNNFQYITLFTGQHRDLVKEKQADYGIDLLEFGNGNRLNNIVAAILNTLDRTRMWDEITHVIVQGDTTSALAVALSAFHHGIKVIHLEAGLRTYDNKNPYPEEANRRLISQITNIHLCPTGKALTNLVQEQIVGDAYVVGNTVIDNLVPYKDKCEYGDKILVTLHRRENHHWIDKWFIEIDKLAKKHIGTYEFILPLHPNPNVQKHKHLLKHVRVIDPLPYDEMLELLVKTRLVITDSGGLQEECSFFNKKCLTCRTVTERPEAIGQSTFMVKAPEDLKNVFNEHIDDCGITYECPFGDGHAAENIIEVFKLIGI